MEWDVGLDEMGWTDKVAWRRLDLPMVFTHIEKLASHLIRQ
jgi:hypothetical protein